MQNKYTVAVCDILGFKNLVAQKSLDKIIDESLNRLRYSLYHSINKQKSPFSIDSLSLKQLQDHTQLGLAWFSDTLLIYTREDSDECLQSLLSTIGWLLFMTMADPDVRLRCGIAYGELHIDPEESLYVGQPLIDAYLLQEKQAWAGGALTSTAEMRLPESARLAGTNYEYYHEWFLIPYPVPLNDQKIFDTLAINWTLGIHSYFDIPWSENRSAPSSEDWKSNSSVCEKWQNTREFHKRVCKFCGHN